MLKWKITTNIVTTFEGKEHRNLRTLFKGNRPTKVHYFKLPERAGEGLSVFPKSLDIKIYSKSRLGNWILEHLIAKRKLIIIDLEFQGW